MQFLDSLLNYLLNLTLYLIVTQFCLTSHTNKSVPCNRFEGLWTVWNKPESERGDRNVLIKNFPSLLLN